MPDGRLSNMVNLTRARDTAQVLAERASRAADRLPQEPKKRAAWSEMKRATSGLAALDDFRCLALIDYCQKNKELPPIFILLVFTPPRWRLRSRSPGPDDDAATAYPTSFERCVAAVVVV
jgi:hypothetical protein